MTIEDKNELWVFGYGSLMWRPGFPFEAQAPGLLKGAHRALCVYSIFYRGTREQPGLVLGLDRGGACRGVVFRVHAGRGRRNRRLFARARADHRGLSRDHSTVRLLDGSGRSVRALTYLADPNHAQYAGRLTLEEQLRIVRTRKGETGDQRRICAEHGAASGGGRRA